MGQRAGHPPGEGGRVPSAGRAGSGSCLRPARPADRGRGLGGGGAVHVALQLGGDVGHRLPDEGALAATGGGARGGGRLRGNTDPRLPLEGAISRLSWNR